MTEENIIPGGAYKEFYSGAPMYRDKNGKPWTINERGEPVTLGPGVTPQPLQFDVHEGPDEDTRGYRHWITNELNVKEWIAPKLVLTNVPIPHVIPPQFAGWFVTDDGLRVVEPVPEPTEPVKSTGYRILSAPSRLILEADANLVMDRGWIPSGGVATDLNGWFYQAMVKLT